MADAYEIRRDVVWPSELALSTRPPAVVYLDLNHFVNMAKIVAGKPAPGYADLLDVCRNAANDGRAIFPLSATHLMEMAAIVGSRQRSDVAAIMEELSKFQYLLGRAIIQVFEVEESLRAIGVDLPLAGGGDLIGRGGFYPFGRHSEIFVEGEGQPAFERLRERLGAEAMDKWMADANREAQWLLLTGGEEGRQGVPAWQRILNDRADREIDQARKIDQAPAIEPDWKREQMRDLVAAAEVYTELNSILARSTRDRVELDQLFPTVDHARRFTDGMPSTRVAITIKTHYHRNAQHEWSPNDVHDIDAISVAVPYCDAVYTDKAMRNALVSNEDVQGVFGTFMPRHAHELIDWLNTRPAPG